MSDMVVDSIRVERAHWWWMRCRDECWWTSKWACQPVLSRWIGCLRFLDSHHSGHQEALLDQQEVKQGCSWLDHTPVGERWCIHFGVARFYARYKLDPKILGNCSKVFDSETFHDLLLHVLKKWTWVADSHTVVDMPCKKASNPDLVGGNVGLFVVEQCVVRVGPYEAKVRHDSSDLFVPFQCWLF